MATYTSILSICAGIGGLELGLERALPTARTVCYVERDAQTCEVLAARIEAGQLDDAPIWSDVTTFDPDPWCGLVDGITAGFPCQPASVAGKRLGTADERWIWPYIQRIIGALRPAFVLLENVAGLYLRGLDTILGSLAEIGFDARWTTVRASEVGAPHQRARIFILAESVPYAMWDAMADGSDDGCKISGSTHNRNGRDESGYFVDGCDPGVAAADRSNGPGERHVGRGDPPIAVPGGNRIDVGANGGASRGEGTGNADGARSQGWEQPDGEGTDKRPTWPPGPSDRAAWAEVLARWPMLAPAECSICRVADGIPDRLDGGTITHGSAEDAGQCGSASASGRSDPSPSVDEVLI